jgi:glycosyltransferase involved in cell wall biosynthesis
MGNVIILSNVFQVVQRLAPGGLETLALALASHLGKRDAIISLEGREQDLINQWPVLSKFEKKILAFEKPKGVSFKLISHLVSLFSKAKPTGIITHHIGPLLYAGLAARLAGVKNIAHVEHDAWHLQSRKRRFVAKLAYTLVRPHIVAVSPKVAEELAILGIKRVSVIKNGIDLAKFTPLDKAKARLSFNIPEGAPIYGASGRLEHVKGHDLLLEAFAKISQDAHLLIAGDGSERIKLKQLAEDLQIENRVHFLGLVSDLPGFYSALDVFVQPSRHEGLPLALLEAQACGVKTVAFDVGGMEEGLCPGTGALVYAGNIEALSEAMTYLYETERAVSPRAFVAHNFNLKDTVNAYRTLIGETS